MNTTTPNPDVEVPAAEVTPSPQPETTPQPGTEQTETVETEQPTHEVDTVDYRKKFSESSAEAQRLLQKNKELEAQLAAANSQPVPPQELETHSPDTSLYPGFEELDPEAQKNLIQYTDAVTRRSVEEMNKNPAISYATKMYNENKWETAYNEVQSEFPELAESKEDFKSKYYSASNVPDNIKDILTECAKSYLFDKARDIGVQQATEIAQRVQLEDPTGGDKTPTPNRSLSDWQRIAQENPAKFAAMKKEYEADLASGKLKE